MVAVGCLPDGNFVIWLQTLLYFLASIFGFFVCIPMGILLRNFQGSCILFAQILDWRPAVIWPWSETACDYVLFMNLAVNIFYATFMGFVSLLIAYKYKIGRSKNLTKLHNWHVAYVLQALNPLFLIINIIIFALEVCSVSVVVAGTSTFCKYVFEYLAKSTTMVTQMSTTPLSLAPTTTTQAAICNFVYSTIDTLTNETVTYSINTCTTSATTLSTASTTTLAISALSSCSALQTWSAWWSQMRIIRGRDQGLKGDNFFVCLVMASIASFLLVIVWLIHMAMNVAMMCRVCSCDVAEEKQHSMDQTRLIAQRRSRLATPSVTPGGGPGRHTPQTFQSDLPEKPPQAGAVPRQFQPSAASPMSPEPLSYREDDYPEKKISPPPSEFDDSDRGFSPQPQYHLPPVSRRMEPSPRRPAAEAQVVSSPDSSMIQQPPAYHSLPPVQARSPPSKLK